MTGHCLRALLSHWRRNPVQLFAFLAGLALATALWSGVQAINAEARASYDAASATLGRGQFDQLIPKEGDRISQQQYVSLRRSGWLVSPVVEGRLEGVRLVGVDPATSPFDLVADAPASPSSALMFESRQSLFANQETARILEPVTRVTADESVAPGMAIGDIGVVQQILRRDDLSRLILLPDQPLDQPDLSTVAPDLRIQTAPQVADVAQLTDSFHLNLTAFGLLSFAVGLFIVHSTIGLAFEQRRGMIRTLRSLGVPLRTLITLITVEMMTLALIGAGLGIILGYLIAALLLPDVAATLRGLYGAQISGTLELRAAWLVSGLVLAVAGTAVALSTRIWQIARMPLLASVRPRAWVTATASRFRLQSMGAVILLASAAALALIWDGLLAGFALLGCLLIGAAMALPAIAARILTSLEKHTIAPVWRWFWADTRQQLPGLSLALMALLLAVTANIGVSTMVSSFRLTFVAFLDQRLAPELFVRVETASQSAALESFLQDNGVEILPLLTAQANVAGLPVDLYGVRVGPTYRNNWNFLDEAPGAWDAVDNGDAVILNEQLARRAGLWVGDQVSLAQGLTKPVAAVVGDYGNPQGQVIVSENIFQDLHPGIYPAQFGIRTEAEAALRRQIVQKLGIEDSAIIDQVAIKALSMQVFERTFVVTSALNILTLGVASFAILMSLLTLADLRVPQLASVWALGLTRRSLGWLELSRAVLLAGLVFLCAIPVGLALAWTLLTVINVEAFGWKLPMYLFPLDYLQLGGYALVAAFLAATWPALRLMRTPPSTLLKVFASER
ncbi:ABC transporter permease [uncultured Aliiroseovarius sp.]|uniref:ABC transporter permease n=1 Tax=uncultured Aliiroseovarius sp. TaxID=1658783 RepID=UPI00261EC662|nr:ABC transporter permease [uncultured Aliiroseovarius sp.]